VLRRLALLCAAFVLAALTVGVISRSPTAQTTGQEACRSDSGSIRAAALPETLELENCQIGGRVITDNGVRAVLPPPGQGVYVEALTTGGAQELEVTRLRDGTVELEHVGDEVEEARASAIMTTDARRRRLGECRDPAYNDEDRRVTAGLSYGFNRSTSPPELTRDAAEGAINTAGTNITGTRNSCRLADGVTAELTYLGDADPPPGESFRLCDGDGSNVVFFGDLAGGTLATTCIVSTVNPSDYNEVIESTSRSTRRISSGR
jgi:hypothetical protein